MINRATIIFQEPTEVESRRAVVQSASDVALHYQWKNLIEWRQTMLFPQHPSKGSPSWDALTSNLAVESHLSLLENGRD